MTANKKTYAFKSEARKLLDLMVRSVYSEKEVFLRELISNASDALDRRRFEALTDPDLLGSEELEVRLVADAAARTLTVSDNGIGMSRQEVIDDLGTIARSGTQEFLTRMAKAQEAGGEASADLIGQFGVGFYSVFMVAERIDVVTRRAGEEGATRWSSDGAGRFAVEDAERGGPGSTVTLHLRPADPEDGLADFAEEWVLREAVRKHSDFVRHPVRLETVRKSGEAAGSKEWVTLNSRKAIWTRPVDEVSDDDYAEFYRHVSRDWQPPLERISLKAEGTFEYTALLFIPESPPGDLFYRDAQWGLQLYVKGVLVVERCGELLPPWLRFVRGVVESPDLSLNVSREMLQQDRRVGAIRSRIVKKVLDACEAMQKGDAERYGKLWQAFGRVLKEGVLHGGEHADRVRPLLLLPSTNDATAPTTLAAYVGRMPEGQPAIYYALGESRAALEASPHLEALRRRGYEVLLLTEAVDELLVQHLGEHDGHKLQFVADANVDLGEDEEPEEVRVAREARDKEHAPLLETIQRHLGEQITEVRLSARLDDSAACLVGEAGALTPHLRRMLRESGHDVPEDKRALELNPDHPVVRRLQELFEVDRADLRIERSSHLLLGQALLAEGSPLPDPAAFSRRLAELMVDAAGPAPAERGAGPPTE